MKRGLSSSQRRVIATLRNQRQRGEVSRADFRTLRRQIRPLALTERLTEEVAQARAAINAQIVSNGYDGHEDCLPPPDGLLIPDTVCLTASPRMKWVSPMVSRCY